MTKSSPCPFTRRCACTKVFEEALNAVKFLGWLKKYFATCKRNGISVKLTVKISSIFVAFLEKSSMNPPRNRQKTLKKSLRKSNDPHMCSPETHYIINLLSSMILKYKNQKLVSIKTWNVICLPIWNFKILLIGHSCCFWHDQ